MAHRPEFLVLDEPSANLDPAGRRELAEVLQSTAETMMHRNRFRREVKALTAEGRSLRIVEAVHLVSALGFTVEIDHSGSMPKIVHFGCTRLLPEAIVEGEIMDSMSVIALLLAERQRSGETR